MNTTAGRKKQSLLPPDPGLEKMTTTARRGEATRGAIIDKRLRSHLSRDPDAKEINNSHGPKNKLKSELLSPNTWAHKDTQRVYH